MSLSSRQFLSTRNIFRVILLFIFLLVGLLTYKSSIPSNNYCSNSAECYNLLKEKTRQLRNSAANGFLNQSPSLQQNEPDNELEASLEFGQNQATDETSEDLSLIEEEEIAGPYASRQEYKILSDNTLPRVKAAFVVLVRNSELYALRSSMRYLEDRFNHKFNYPWIFLNEQPFTEEFKNMTRTMTKAEIHYGLVPEEHWSYPDWIDQDVAAKCRKVMEEKQIVYGGSESYRHMCRYQSGFFMLHPLLDDLDYYWRVEPGVKFSCDIEYDPFRLMQERDLKYGFTIALREYFSTIPSLWKTTIEFAKQFPHYIYPRSEPDSLLRFISDDKGWTYNLCHFWSNFEGYQAYFKYLDKAGGFFYERWGDAPVHSIAVAMMLKRSDVHWFYDIGYKHDDFEHCPTEQKWLINSKCYCNPTTSFDFNQGSCTPIFLDAVNRTASSYIVTRPDDDDFPL